MKTFFNIVCFYIIKCELFTFILLVLFMLYIKIDIINIVTWVSTTYLFLKRFKVVSNC